MGFAHLFHINIYNQRIDSILSNRPPNYCSWAQKCQQLHLVMFRVLIRVLISLWTTKPVHPSSARHWGLAVLFELNMSKIKTTRTKRNFLFLETHLVPAVPTLSDCYSKVSPDSEIQPPSHGVRGCLLWLDLLTLHWAAPCPLHCTWN